jgi:hypothetical protein
MKIKLLFAALLVFFAVSSNGQNASADTSIAIETIPAPASRGISGNFEMNYLRHYLWRGALFGNNDVAQPELVLTKNNFSLAFSANLNYVPKNVPKEYYTKNAVFDEQDVELRYSNNWGKFDCEFKAMAYFYFYQSNTPNTAELYSWTGYKLYKDFSFFTENSLDVVSYTGAVYSNNGIYYEHAFSKDITVEWSVYGGFANKKFNRTYYYSESAGLNLVGTHIEITKAINKFYLKAIGEANRYTSSSIREGIGLKRTENFGLAIGRSF